MVLSTLQRNLASSPASVTILVADSDPSIGQDLMGRLRALGYDPTWVQLIQDLTMALEAGTVDVLLLSVQWLDQGLNLRAIAPIPVILLGADQERSRAYEAGGIDYLTLPFSSAELRAKLQLHTQHQALAAQLRQQQQQHYQQQERWRLLMKGTGDGIFDWDITTGQVMMTARWMSMLGYMEGDFVGTIATWKDLLHPDDRDRTLAAQQAYIDHQSPDYQHEFRLRCADGSYKWVLARGQAVWDESGCPVRMVGWHQDISDRKQLELALQASKAQLSDILNSIGASIGSFRYYDDGSWETVYHSLGCVAVFGYPLAIFPVEKWLSCIVPEDAETFIPQLLTMIRQEQSNTFEYRYRHPDGSIRWISDTITSRRDEIESCWIVTMVGIDISDRRRAEQAQRDSEARFRAIFEAAQIGIVVGAAPDYWLSFTNPCFLNLLGYSAEELATYQCSDISYPDDLPAEHELFDECLAGQRDCYQLEKRFICKDGHIIWTHVIVSMVRDAWGQIQAAIALVEDISDRKRADLALQESETRFRDLIEQTSDWVWQTDADDRFTYVSPQVEYILGYAPAQVLGHTTFDFMEPLERDRVRSILRPYMERALSFTGVEKTLIHQSGRLVTLETSGSPILDAQGWLLGYRGIARDITERKQAELKLRLAKQEAEAANVAKSQFLASMSHELRTPLNAILGFAQVMGYDTQLSADHRNFVQTILRSGEHLLELINEVLDLSKIEAGHMSIEYSTLNLPDFIRTSCEMLYQQADMKGLVLHFDIAEDTPSHIITDAHKLRQVLINLLGNAIKFTEQGQIFLRVAATVHPHCDRQQLTQVILTFEVEDTGIGIAPEHQAKIFEAFEQVSDGSKCAGGTGLGLTISRRLLDLLGGQITLDSQPQQGSLFRFSIPVRLATPADLGQILPTHVVIGIAPDQPTYRILVVDDQEDNCQFLIQTLNIIGFETQAADRGEAAIALWKQWQPHLILMDINMPGVDGYAATRHIRRVEQSQRGDQRGDQHPSPTRILAMSASAFDRDRTYALDVGCDDFLTKPIQLQTLFHKIASLIPVQYVFSQTMNIVPAPPTLSSDQLGVMPREWIEELYRGAILCDSTRIDQLLKQIPAHHMLLKEGLQRYNDMSRLDIILDLADACLRINRS